MSRPRILSHIFKSPCAMRSRPSLVVLKPSLSSHSWIWHSKACQACWRLLRPHRQLRTRATTIFDMQPDKAVSADAVARAFRTLEGLPEDEREATEQRVPGVRRRRAQGLATCSVTSTRSTAHAAGRLPPGEGPSLSSLAKILVGERPPAPESQQKNNLDNKHRQCYSVEIGTVDARHNSAWRLLGSPRDTLARKRAHGGSATLGSKAGLGGLFSQAVEVVGQHCSATRSGVALAGPLHISSSVPTEFAAMLDDAVFMAPEGVEQPLNYLRSRILARHIHAMLKRGVTLVTVHLEPGIRASGLNLWLLEVLAAFCLSFDGPGLLWATGTCSRTSCPRPAGSTPSMARSSQHHRSRGQEERGAVLDYFVVSAAIAHMVQQVDVVDNSPTTPHWPVRLTSWGRSGLGTTTSEAFPNGGACGTTETRGTFRMDLGEEIPDDLELAWLEWLRAAEGAWCRVHDLCGAQRRPFLGRSKGLVIEHVSLAQATRKDTRKGFNKKAAAWRAFRRIVAQAVGNLAAWRKGRTHLHTPQRSVQTVAAVSLPDLGPWDAGWEFPSHEALANTPYTKQSPARIGQIWPGESCFASHATRNTRSMFRRQWAKEARSGSAGAGHAFTKLGTDNSEHCALAGPELLVKQMEDMAAAMVGRAQGEREAARRLGGLGKRFATRRGR